MSHVQGVTTVAVLVQSYKILRMANQSQKNKKITRCW